MDSLPAAPQGAAPTVPALPRVLGGGTEPPGPPGGPESSGYSFPGWDVGREGADKHHK